VSRNSTTQRDVTHGKGGKTDKMVVHSGPRTRILEGPELGEWLANRK